MSYFIYSELFSSLLDPRLVEHGSTLIHIGVSYDPKINSALGLEIVMLIQIENNKGKKPRLKQKSKKPSQQIIENKIRSDISVKSTNRHINAKFKIKKEKSQVNKHGESSQL